MIVDTAARGHPAQSRTSVTLLVVASILAGGATLLVPDLLTGPAAMNGSAKGTALVVVLGGAPVLAFTYRRARSGSLAPLALAVGATGYLAYNAVLLAFATPFNRAFPLYEAMLGFGIWSLAALTRDIWARAVELSPPASRWAAGFIAMVVLVNLAAWAGTVVPALLSDDPGSMLAGTGLTTNPVYVQDLAFWLPSLAWIAVGMWKGHGPRTALGAAGLCYWILESTSVAVDQWWGHHADPTSAVVSVAMVPVFLVIGVATVGPLVSVLKAMATPRRGSAGVVHAREATVGTRRG